MNYIPIIIGRFIMYSWRYKTGSVPGFRLHSSDGLIEWEQNLISSLLQWIKRFRTLLLMILNRFVFWIKTKINFTLLILLFFVPFYPILPSEFSWIACHLKLMHNDMHNILISWRPYFESKLNSVFKQNFYSFYWHKTLFHF